MYKLYIYFLFFCESLLYFNLVYYGIFKPEEKGEN